MSFACSDIRCRELEEPRSKHGEVPLATRSDFIRQLSDVVYRLVIVLAHANCLHCSFVGPKFHVVKA